MQFLISTISDITMDESCVPPLILYNDNSLKTANEYGLGLEIAEFCVSENLDKRLYLVDEGIRRKVAGVPYATLHAPYNELYPSAIDSGYAKYVKGRFNETLEAAARYGLKKIIVHANYLPTVYFKSYFISQSIRFWSEFLSENPGDYELCLENTIEEDPSYIVPIVSEIDDKRLKLCLDIGHANLFNCPLDTWLDEFAPYLSHMHIHNNLGRTEGGMLTVVGDLHHHPGDGIIDMKHILTRVNAICPDVTIAMETMDIKEGCIWLQENGFI